jgi:hypothetical protein
LALPQASKARGGAEFPGFRTLVLGYRHGLLETGFGFTLVVCRQLQEECALEAMELCVVEMLSSIIDGSQRFDQDGKSFFICPIFPYASARSPSHHALCSLAPVV